MTMISGGKEEASSSIEDKRFLPIGPIFGYPFWFLGKSLGDKADDEAKEQMDKANQGTDPTTGRANTPDDIERNRLADENQALRDQLQQRAAAPAPPVSGAPSTRVAQAPRISDELAALERSLGKRAGATGAPGNGSAPQASRPHSARQAGARRAGSDRSQRRRPPGPVDLHARTVGPRSRHSTRTTTGASIATCTTTTRAGSSRATTT